MTILTSILLACHGIEEGCLTEPVVFFIGHYIHYVLSFQFCFVLSSYNYHMVKEEKGE